MTLNLDFQGQFFISCISWMDGPIDFLTLNFDLTHDIDLEFWRSND